MDTYEFDGRDARSCRECGYVDVPVRHEPERRHTESWDDAIERFQEQYAAVTVSDSDSPDEPAANGSADAQSARGIREGQSGNGSSVEATDGESVAETPDGEPTDEASVDGSSEEASPTDD